MKRVLGSQGFVTSIGVTLVALVAVVGYLLAFDPLKKTSAYCAIMPDAIGLYPGNQVTMLGIPVGTVRSITPENGSVRVDFDIEAGRPLRGEVVATTVNDTLVADRELEVLGEVEAPTDWDRDRCITKTFTPKSISQTLQAFTGLANELTADGTEQTGIRDSVTAFEAATSGTGPKLNQLIKDLGDALRQPDAAIGHIGALLDSFAALSSSVALNWGDIKSMLLQVGPGIAFINEVWVDTVKLIDSLLVVLPWLNTIAHKYGHDILNGIDETLPYLKLLSASIGSLQKIIDMIPPLAELFRQSADPETGQVRVTYASPKVALPQANAEQLCAAVNAVAPGRCRTAENGLATADLVPLVLGLAGAQ
ncbi:MlaD family protein [Nocardia sp. NPDC127526]|uniref:MlaD family protein n=1 Tax=Nocardia sp. NPDC127526 TaxID=3345393 RepID=UPI003643FAAA